MPTGFCGFFVISKTGAFITVSMRLSAVLASIVPLAANMILASAVEMMRVSRCPAVAIGGITGEAQVAELAAAGFANFAVVRAVCASDDPYAAIVRLQRAFSQARHA